MATDHLQWRYAVKKFDPARKISPSQLEEILEILRLSPSSFGLQPWKFIVIEDLKLRKKIQPLAWNQTQVADCSHLIVLCALKHMDAAYVKQFIRLTAKTRGVEESSLAGYEKVILGFIQKLSPEAQQNWMKNQVYLALGMLLSECAQRKIDTCPMEGFEPEKVDALLGLDAQNLNAVVMCPIGYRASDDKQADLKKVRFERDAVTLFQ